MIRATVTGIRDIKSKLRHGLVDYSLVKVSLVKGKEVWRIVNVATQGNYYYEFRKDPERTQMLAKVMLILRRFLSGEEKNAELYDAVEEMFDMMAKVSISHLPAVEYIGILRIMHLLGYVGEVVEMQTFLDPHNWNEEVLLSAIAKKTALIKEINRALKESHL
jgi:recombinational DNA repair protein (RecF pathway)